jgi:hypothetical protein
MTIREILASRPAIAVLCLVVGAGIATFARPARVEERLTTVEVVRLQAKVETKEVVRESSDAKKERVVYVDRVVSPTGEVHEKRTTTTKADTRELVDLGKTSESTGKTENITATTTTVRPDWRVGVLVGTSLREPLVPIAGPLVLGASLERRIVGGLSAGAWANTSGAAGASLSMEF